MTETELLELKIYAVYQTHASTHPVGTPCPESRELRELWDRVEWLYEQEEAA